MYLKARLKRRQLSSDEVDKYKENTPALKKGSTRLFRNLRDKGNLLEILCKLMVFYR